MAGSVPRAAGLQMELPIYGLTRQNRLGSEEVTQLAGSRGGLLSTYYGLSPLSWEQDQ